MKPVCLWEEEVHSYDHGQLLVTLIEGLSGLHGNMRKKFVHAKTRKYRHPMVEKAVGVTSATMKLQRISKL
jgi:hypothetical protein